ncbi:hypothetical protein F4778DRAFT_780118 [Xylariomycetidae sp. FL2044]|nr:hypothetical protein F4778DRAFT_780118 [Xylariomycetidae sp. FL2044]
MKFMFLLMCTSFACSAHEPMAYNHIIAGGATAGLVVANRLSEDPSVTVAIVEPGKDVRDDPGVLDIDLAGVTYSPALDWAVKSSIQPQLGDRVIDHHVGTALGGTTVINSVYYIRGDKAIYDAWEQIGNPGCKNAQSPAIHPNFLSIDLDKETAVKVGRIAREMWSTEPSRQFAGTLIVPGDAALPVNATDGQWTEFLTSVPTFHCIGTCAMLPRELGGVVDPALKVYGTANLRVVDASVIPGLMSGHPSAAVYAVAEGAADLIKNNPSI